MTPRRAIVGLLLFLASAMAGPAFAKGEGVGMWMEGTVSNVKVAGDQVRFVLKGHFRFDQYIDNVRSNIEIDGQEGIRVALRQADPFFAMTTDWRGGAIRGKGALSALVTAAARSRRPVKFELVEAKIQLKNGLKLSVDDGRVVRATDNDLR